MQKGSHWWRPNYLILFASDSERPLEPPELFGQIAILVLDPVALLTRARLRFQVQVEVLLRVVRVAEPGTRTVVPDRRSRVRGPGINGTHSRTDSDFTDPTFLPKTLYFSSLRWSVFRLSYG